MGGILLYGQSDMAVMKLRREKTFDIASVRCHLLHLRRVGYAHQYAVTRHALRRKVAHGLRGMSLLFKTSGIFQPCLPEFLIRKIAMFDSSDIRLRRSRWSFCLASSRDRLRGRRAYADARTAGKCHGRPLFRHHLTAHRLYRGIRRL